MPSASIPNPATVPFVLFWYCADKSSWLINKYDDAVISSYNGVDATLIVVSLALWSAVTVNFKGTSLFSLTKLKVSPVLKTVEPIASIGTEVNDF